MKRHLLLTLTALLLLLAGCGGSSGSDAKIGDDTTSTSAAGTSDAPPKTDAPSEPTTTVAEIGGDLLEPGELPAPWVAATDSAVHTFAKLGPEGTSAYSAGCPASLTAVAEGNTQCATYADEGGPFASLTDTTPDGTARTTLLCQSGDKDSLDFTAVATLDAKVASSGGGAVDIDGRSFAANAYTTGPATNWFVLRRPAGQDCPVVWDLGADDGTLTPTSGLGSVLLPLTDGPTCVFVVPEGLRTRAAENGTCMP